MITIQLDSKKNKHSLMTEIDCMWDFNYLAGIQIQLISIMSSAKKQTKIKTTISVRIGTGTKNLLGYFD